MLNPFDSDSGNGGTGKISQKYTAQRIANRSSEPLLQRLDYETPVFIITSKTFYIETAKPNKRHLLASHAYLELYSTTDAILYFASISSGVGQRLNLQRVFSFIQVQPARNVLLPIPLATIFIVFAH
jgi:hypothetical protein